MLKEGNKLTEILFGVKSLKNTSNHPQRNHNQGGNQSICKEFTDCTNIITIHQVCLTFYYTIDSFHQSTCINQRVSILCYYRYR